jgi:hypothetical protein
MNQALDDLFKSSGIFFLPWIGNEYEQGFCGRKFLVLGESHYAHWDAAVHDLPPTFTRECIQEVVSRQDGARFWKNVDQALLNERREGGWCPGGGLPCGTNLLFISLSSFQLPQARASAPPTSTSMILYWPLISCLKHFVQNECLFVASDYGGRWIRPNYNCMNTLKPTSFQMGLRYGV